MSRWPRPGARERMNGCEEWVRGYAAALAALQRMFDRPTEVISILNADGLTVAELKAAGVEDFDLRELKEATAGESPDAVRARGGRRRRSAQTGARGGRA